MVVNVVAEGEGRSILVISDNASVHGKVSASQVIINGEVRGPLHFSELLELRPKALVVRYETLEMNPGALVEADLKPLKSTENPALKLAGSNEV